MSIGTRPQAACGHMDAGHVPFLICGTKETLWPGDFVQIDINENRAFWSERNSAHGIIDPFYSFTSIAGDRVRVLIDPKYVDGALWHHFTLTIPKEVDQETEEGAGDGYTV